MYTYYYVHSFKRIRITMYLCLCKCIDKVYLQEEAGGSVPPIEAGKLFVEAEEDGENQR